MTSLPWMRTTSEGTGRGAGAGRARPRATRARTRERRTLGEGTAACWLWLMRLLLSLGWLVVKTEGGSGGCVVEWEEAFYLVVRGPFSPKLGDTAIVHVDGLCLLHEILHELRRTRCPEAATGYSSGRGRRACVCVATPTFHGVARYDVRRPPPRTM